MSVVLHFQSTGTVPGNGKPFRMVGQSISVGRSEANDLVLPDAEKVVSGRHCSIEDQGGGNIVVIDLSTNGTFLNYGKIALGNTPTPLNDGDILSIGTYEILVDVQSARAADSIAGIAEPIAAAPLSHGNASAAGESSSLLDDPTGSSGVDFLDDLLGEPALKGPASVKRDVPGDDGLMPPLDDDESDLMVPSDDPNEGLGASRSSHSSAMEDHFITPAPASSAIPDDWDDDLGIDVGLPTQVTAPPPVSARLGSPAFIPEDIDDLAGISGPVEQNSDEDHSEDPFTTPELPAKTVAEPSPEPVSQDAQTAIPAATGIAHQAARAFLEAAGVANLNLADEDLVETMARMGNTMRIMIQGMREILMTRTSIKSEFRINQTVISAGNNNPLKFSVSGQAATEALINRAATGYLLSEVAAEQALGDIKAHEVAMMTGMEAAIKGLLARLAPDELEKSISKDSIFRSVLTNKKARYWEVFESRYQKIADAAENDFHEIFAKEFARAYQDQFERLK